MAIRLTCEFETITPQKAKEYLELSVQNRHVRKERVALYAQMMKRGDWYATNQGIGFDEHGHLIDGQHRLLGLIESNTSATILVVRGLKDGTQLVLDQPVVRQLHDQIRLDKGVDCGTLHIAAARQMLASTSEGDQVRLMRRDPMLVERVYMTYKQGIDYVVHLFAGKQPGVKGLILAPVVAATARGYYQTQDPSQLDQFVETLITGFTDKASGSGAIALRNYLISTHGKVRSHTARREIYVRAEICLKAFLDRKRLEKLPRRIDVTQELLPLPKLRKAGAAGLPIS